MRLRPLAVRLLVYGAVLVGLARVGNLLLALGCALLILLQSSVEVWHWSPQRPSFPYLRDLSHP